MLYWELEHLKSQGWCRVWQGLLQHGLEHESFKTSTQLVFGQCTTGNWCSVCVTAALILWEVGDQVCWENVLLRQLNFIILQFSLLFLMKFYCGKKNLELQYAKVCLEGQLNFIDLKLEFLNPLTDELIHFYSGNKIKNLSQKVLIKLLIPSISPHFPPLDFYCTPTQV